MVKQIIYVDRIQDVHIGGSSGALRPLWSVSGLDEWRASAPDHLDGSRSSRFALGDCLNKGVVDHPSLTGGGFNMILAVIFCSLLIGMLIAAVGTGAVQQLMKAREGGYWGHLFSLFVAYGGVVVFCFWYFR